MTVSIFWSYLSVVTATNQRIYLYRNRIRACLPMQPFVKRTRLPYPHPEFDSLVSLFLPPMIWASPSSPSIAQKDRHRKPWQPWIEHREYLPWPCPYDRNRRGEPRRFRQRSLDNHHLVLWILLALYPISLLIASSYGMYRSKKPACCIFQGGGEDLIPKAVTFFPFLINWTRTHFRIAELGCLASTPTFSRTMPLACEEPPNGDDLNWVPSARFL